MIILFALKQSRAYRIAWLLELLGVDYQVQVIERDPNSKLAPESLRDIHPLGKSPLIQDSENNHVIIAESGAICEYLLAKYDTQGQFQLAPDHAEYWAYRQWLHYAEGSLMPLLVMSLIFRKIDDTPKPFFAKPIAQKITDGFRNSFLNPQTKLHLNYIEQYLNNNNNHKTWLVGEKITAADVMMSFPLQAACKRLSNSNINNINMDYPNILAYVARIEAEPHYQQAEQKLGKLGIL